MALFTVNPYLVAAFVCACVYLLYRYMKDTYSVLQKLGIPCPKPIWVFGNTHEMKDKDPLQVFKEWRKEFGDVYGFYEGFRAGVVVHGPKMAEEILSKKFDYFHIRSSYRPFVYEPAHMTLVNVAGETWKHQRAVINKTLNYNDTVKQIIRKVKTSSEALIQNLEEKRKVHTNGFDISYLVKQYISNTMARVLLDLDEEDIREHGDSLHEYEIVSNLSASPENKLVGLALLFPTLAPLLQKSDTEHKKHHSKIVNLLRTYFKTTVEGQNNNEMKQGDHPSLLSHLISSNVQARDIDGSLTRRPMSHDEVIAHLLSLISETYTTSSSASLFMLYELAKNPTVQDKLYEEICHVCQQGDLQMTSLQSMEYFEKVFNETYRVHPIAPGVSRECSQDCTVQGIHFKKGMTVRIMTDTMYSDHSLFPNPEHFDPERFDRANRDERPTFSFLPFGMGPRMCPGQKIAMIVLKLFIVHVLQNYRLEVTEETEIPMKHALRPSICPKNGVNLRLIQRS